MYGETETYVNRVQSIETAGGHELRLTTIDMQP
jgi:hypothetical protein